MNDLTRLELCQKCRVEIIDNFCSKCGNPKSLRRIDGNYITTEVSKVLNFDKGILYTIKELLIRPKNTIKTFILNDRSRIVKPIIWIIISSLTYSVFKQFLNFEDGHFLSGNNSTELNPINSWLGDNYGYTNFIMGLFIAFWTKLFFKKSNYNYYEILILLCFVMGMVMLILTVFGIIETIIGYNTMQFGIIISIIYFTWAIGQFFNSKKASSYLKAFFSYILGVVTFAIGVTVIEKIIISIA